MTAAGSLWKEAIGTLGGFQTGVNFSLRVLARDRTTVHNHMHHSAQSPYVYNRTVFINHGRPTCRVPCP